MIDVGAALEYLGVDFHSCRGMPQTEAEYRVAVTMRGQSPLPVWAAILSADQALKLPTPQMVRVEASRRMQQLVGARDAAHLDIIIANANREAIRLLRKGSENWTAAEAARASELEASDLAIEAIRAASNLLEANPPANFDNDLHWPPLPTSNSGA